MLGRLTAAATRSGLFGWVGKMAGLSPDWIIRRLPLLKEWSIGREPPRLDGPTFRELWDEGIE